MGFVRRAQLSLRSNARALLAPPYSHLMIASDTAGWVLDEEAREMIRLAGILRFPAYMAPRPLRALPQCVHYTSFFSLADTRIFASKHRISVDYYHGKPDQDPAFREVFDSMRKHASRLHRVRLSYSGMKPLALEAGVPEERIHRIPIGINPAFFRRQTPELKARARARLGLPESAVIVGSFQKDGQGWGEGMEPKWVKGPDVFLRSLEILRRQVPDLFVLLTGPSRGFVKQGLEKLKIPFRHFLLDRYSDIGLYYDAIDLYIVASREEGGPKAILESMTAGVPIVTTRVGQAIDLVQHEHNGLMAEVEDAEALAGLGGRVLGDSALRRRLVDNGFITAATETYDAQLPRWRSFFSGFVDGKGQG